MDYSDSRFTKMQEDAVRRVQEMQRRSREAVGAEEEIRESVPSAPPLSGITALSGKIKIDEEKALIGLLIYILYKQGADIKLLLGLGYLLL